MDDPHDFQPRGSQSPALDEEGASIASSRAHRSAANQYLNQSDLDFMSQDGVIPNETSGMMERGLRPFPGISNNPHAAHP